MKSFFFPPPVFAQTNEASLDSSSVPKINLDSLIESSGLNSNLDSPSGIINGLLVNYVFVIAGLILFGMLIIGGFQMLSSGGNPKAADAGKSRITNAVLGFFIVFAAYWITQMIQVIFGINIL